MKCLTWLRPCRRNTLVMTTGDAEAKLVAVQKYLWETHEQEHADSRRAAREPFRIRHEEGLLVKELKLHLNIVRSYDWHMLAAAREQSSMRESLENLAPRTCYFQADFSENIGVPIASEESSDMWHGAARKTLSVFGVYLRQWQNGKVCTRNVLYISEVLEKSALFASLLIRRAVEREVLHLGKLENLLFVFDAGNHFRSYEGAYNTMVHIPRSYRQRCETRYMVEKHGKGPCDSQLFSPMRRFLKQACMLPNFFADSEHAVVAALQAAAAAEHAANPNGPTWVIEVPELPAERPSTCTLAMQNCQINRSYCFESIISARARAGVQIKNWVFSDSSDCETVRFTVEPKEPDFAQWKKGYFQDPSWQKPPLELGCDNSITRKYLYQKNRPSTKRDMQKLSRPTETSLSQRDERHLRSHLQRLRAKREATRKALAEDSDVSL